MMLFFSILFIIFFFDDFFEKSYLLFCCYIFFFYFCIRFPVMGYANSFFEYFYISDREVVPAACAYSFFICFSHIGS